MSAPLDRRAFLSQSALVAGSLLSAAGVPLVQGAEEVKPARLRPIRLGVSTYSFWQFREQRVEIEDCIEQAARLGFDGVEILQVQMKEESNGYLQQLKRLAFSLGLDLMGFSTHQGFVSPDKAVRKQNIDKTLHSIELAYRLGIPTMRVNTGRWGTTKSFDELMANKGIEPRLEGYTDEQGFTWWDYRGGSFHRGMGLRIDLLLASEPLAGGIKACGSDRDFRKGPKPSDHAPLIVELA